MKSIALIFLAVGLAFPAANHAANWTAGMKEGKLELKSAGPIAFGPDGILLIADTKAAAIAAVATGDTKAAETAKLNKVQGINQKIAGLLGTSADQILIEDLAVNPISRNVYLAVSRGRGADATPVIIRMVGDGQPELVTLDKAKFSRAELPDAPTESAGQGNRQSNPRRESVTDIAFLEDRVLIAGLSNEEFASTLRAVPFPFKTVANGTSAEIYHGSHGRFETRAPIRTFVPFKIGNEAHLLAAYTCTPLVQFPLSQIQPGARIKGKTIAELGNRNRPIDMIVYQKGGKDYLLLANSSRGVMKISTDQIEKSENIQEPVKDKKGLPYETIDSWTGIDQLDRLDNQHAVVLRRGEGGALNLESLALP
ncbi:MAG TPA: hypothetical protein VK850_07690 [Candidatus Binatia bacterium]|nr:hypothetical protein [Candidatus Binatia bacterium]